MSKNQPSITCMQGKEREGGRENNRVIETEGGRVTGREGKREG